MRKIVVKSRGATRLPALKIDDITNITEINPTKGRYCMSDCDYHYRSVVAPDLRGTIVARSGCTPVTQGNMQVKLGNKLAMWENTSVTKARLVRSVSIWVMKETSGREKSESIEVMRD